MRIGLVGLVVFALAGCANTVGMDPSETVAGFDKARVVNIAPHGVGCVGGVGPCLALGAEWSSAKPGGALLTLLVLGPEYAGVQRLSIRADGQETALQSAGLSQFKPGAPPWRESTQTFSVPLDLVRKIAGGQSVWLRAHTTTGYIDAAVIDGQQDSKAVHALRRFLAAVDKT